MSKLVVTDDFLWCSIVNYGHRVPFGIELGKFSFASGDLVFRQWKTLQAFADRLLDRVRNTFAGSFSECPDQLVGFLILDEDGHKSFRIYFLCRIYIGAIDNSSALRFLTFPA